MIQASPSSYRSGIGTSTAVKGWVCGIVEISKGKGQTKDYAGILVWVAVSHGARGKAYPRRRCCGLQLHVGLEERYTPAGYGAQSRTEGRHQPDLASRIKAGNQREVDQVKTYELMN